MTGKRTRGRKPAPRDYEGEASEVVAELARDNPTDDEEFILSAGCVRALLARVP